MSKRHTVTLHHVITVDNDMFDHMDGVMGGIGQENDTMEGRLILCCEVCTAKVI